MANELTLTEDPAGSGFYVGRGLGLQDPGTTAGNWTDPDYWKFEALARDRVAVAVDTPESVLNPYVELRDAGDQNVYGDDDGGPDADACISPRPGRLPRHRERVSFRSS